MKIHAIIDNSETNREIL